MKDRPSRTPLAFPEQLDKLVESSIEHCVETAAVDFPSATPPNAAR
jgi:hypothetical protein